MCERESVIRLRKAYGRQGTCESVKVRKSERVHVGKRGREKGNFLPQTLDRWPQVFLEAKKPITPYGLFALR